MTLGANVKLIPASIVYGETLEDDTITVDYNLPIVKRAAQTPVLGDPYPGDAYVSAQTAPWGYTVVETGSLTSQKSPDQGAYITAVVYAKPKVPFASGMTGLYEVARQSETGRRGRYLGVRVFLAADGQAESLAEQHLAEKTAMTASGNWQYALLREKKIERRWRVGIAKITATYDTYAPIGEIIVVNKGILEADATAVMMANRAKVPNTQYRIDEIYWEDGVRKKWVVVQGNNAWPLVRADFRIRAVMTTSYLNTVKALVGLVNKYACSHICSAPEGTLWFNKFFMRQRQRGQSTLYDCLIYLAYDPLGWDAETLAQLQKFDIREEKVKDNDGAEISGARHRTGSWIPNSNADPTKIPLPSGTASFAALNGLLS